MPPFDVAHVRNQFPALRRTVDGQPAAYLDGPGGTQTPQRVVDAVVDYLVNHNCNIHGAFATSEETDVVVQAAHEAGADLLGCRWEEVSYGANMTTLALLLSDAIARDIKPGDEVLVTQLDHEANRGPWLRLAERGAVVREVPVDLETCTLDWDAFERLVEPGKTRLVAVGYASNAVGTVNDVARAAALARAAGALSVMDAVHYALHGPIDVRAIGCDFLLCSAYKFFGPHVGLMYARREATELLEPVRLCHAGAGPALRLGDRHAEPRGHGRHHRGHRLHRRPRRAAPRHGGGPPARRPAGPAQGGRRRHAGRRGLRAAARRSGCASSSPASPASRSTGRRRAARARRPCRSRSTASRPARCAVRSARAACSPGTETSTPTVS